VSPDQVIIQKSLYSTSLAPSSATATASPAAKSGSSCPCPDAPLITCPSGSDVVTLEKGGEVSFVTGKTYILAAGEKYVVPRTGEEVGLFKAEEGKTLCVKVRLGC
jgi:hypothetical protein